MFTSLLISVSRAEVCDRVYAVFEIVCDLAFALTNGGGCCAIALALVSLIADRELSKPTAQNSHTWLGSSSAAWKEVKLARSLKGDDFAISVREFRANASWSLFPDAIARSTTLNKARKFSV
jgi:hypothetical protein